MKLSKYSFGVGDRFAREADAQLKAIVEAKNEGIEISPVWNKSYREHHIIHSNPEDTFKAAEHAVKKLGWEAPYYVDADHINMETVDYFIDHANFFTLDVADFINQEVPEEEVQAFIQEQQDYLGYLSIPGIETPFEVTRDFLLQTAGKYLKAAKEALKICQHISAQKGIGSFITEVSMDEVDDPQSPLEMFFILKMLSPIPLQTIAPKFTGQFYKGVDYVGDVNKFEKEFDEILYVLEYAKSQFNLPTDLKLSIHSGSDKFSIYPVIKKLTRKHDQGIHLKTAGTTWLEEVIGLALSGEEGLSLVKDIYSEALGRMEELCGPYRTVIDIHTENLPSVAEVRTWDGGKFANTLRHIPGHPDYNSNFRQLIHVGYKIAAQMGGKYIHALEKYHDIISKQVYENLMERHIKRIFPVVETNKNGGNK